MRTDASRLSWAVYLAADAHCDQFDKVGRPYILHPMRVMLQMDTDEERIVAILHDAIEDTWVTLEYLWSALTTNELAALDAISRRKGEPYRSYILRVKANPLARKVKLADLKDNLARIDGLPPEKLGELFIRYSNAVEILSPA